jgi:hypothetical protein
MKTFLGFASVVVLLAGCSSATLPEPAPEPEVVEEATPEPEVVEEEPDALKEEIAPAEYHDPWGEWDGLGTVFLTPDAITPESPSDFVEVTATGLEDKETFDRRVGDFVTNPSHIFRATFRCAPEPVDVIVNAEFAQEQALQEAKRFAHLLGQMPVGLRGLVREIWVHDGNEAAGGGNYSILVHSVYADENKDFIEEVFAHEGAHTSLDHDQGGVVDQTLWEEAVASDDRFISGYAEEFPGREDIAESYGAFLIWALHRDQGLFPESAAGIEALIPARLQYFESLGPDFGPLPASCGS